jgi:hypothetical protein
MPIDFPSSPTVGQKYTYNSIVYTFTGTTWTASANISQYSDPVLTGVPTAPTPPAATNTQQIATTAFVQQVVAAAVAAIPPPIREVPAGSVMVFHTSAAPAGWVKRTDYDDRALRCVSGNVTAGGVQPFSTAFGRTAVDNHTLDGNELTYHGHGITDPTHAHGIGDPGHAHVVPCGDSEISGNTDTAPGGSAPLVISNGSYWSTWTDSRGVGIWTGGAYTGQGISAAGASWGHTHGMDIRVLYVDVIIATKD